MAEHGEPITVLCLHGCNQNEKMFRSILKNPITKIFEKCEKNETPIKFLFTEAEYDHPLGGKTWYETPLDVSQIGKIEFSKELVGDTLEKLHNIITENNVDVLLGFSQGGNVVDTYLKHFPHERIKKAIIMAGYSLVCPYHIHIDNVELLSVISDSDEIVPADLSPKGYRVSDIIKHDKGHKIPGNPILRQIKHFILNGVSNN